jgi:hypothetical protein
VNQKRRVTPSADPPTRSVEPVQDGRIFIEKINSPFLSEFKGSPAECKAGRKLAIERGPL